MILEKSVRRKLLTINDLEAEVGIGHLSPPLHL